MSEDEMRERVESVEGSYPLFVDMTMNYIRNDGIGEKIVEFINFNPNATASDVIKETNRLVYGF